MKSIYFISLFISLVLIIVGLLIYKLPAKKINIWYGYKSASSMKDQNHWDFAQKVSGKFCLIEGIITLIISIIIGLITYNRDIFKTIGIILIFINSFEIMAIVIYTEIRLKHHFINK